MKRNWILAAAVAAMLTAAAPQVNAQSMMPKAMMSRMPDYSLLSGRTFDYTDLQVASRLGYKESEIATMAKISEKTGWSFREVLGKVARGETFGTIATYANLKLSDVMDATDEQESIDAYKMAYEGTGMMSMKKMDMMKKDMMK